MENEVRVEESIAGAKAQIEGTARFQTKINLESGGAESR
jgi:hypothetical protein